MKPATRLRLRIIPTLLACAYLFEAVIQGSALVPCVLRKRVGKRRQRIVYVGRVYDGEAVEGAGAGVGELGLQEEGGHAD